MDQEFLENLWVTLATELTDEGIRRQRDEDPEMEALTQEQIVLSAQAKSCLDGLDAQTRDTLIRYHEQAETIADMQIKYLYLQGAKDCVKLLKTLGVI